MLFFMRFKDFSYEYNHQIKQAKLEYHKMQFENCNSKQLFQKVEKLSKPKSSKVLPSKINGASLADRFSIFFADKIERIKENLNSQPSETINTQYTCENSSTATFSSLAVMSEDLVRGIIMKSPLTSCNLDPIPTWLLKKMCWWTCSNHNAIYKYVVSKWTFSRFSQICSDHTQVPVIKKPSLDCENLKDYRPVANLKFLAKTIERAFSSQIQEYMALSNLRGKM